MTEMAEESSASSENSPTSLERLARSVLDARNAGSQSEGPGLAERGHGGAESLAEVLLSENYSGVFPHPSVLRGLDGVVDQGAERAFRLTEKEQDHRHDCDRKLVDSEIRSRDRESEDRRLLIIMAFVILILALSGAMVAIMTGHPAGAGLAGGGLVIGLGSVYGLTRKQSKGADRDSKDDNEKAS